MKAITENTTLNVSVLALILGAYGYVASVGASTAANQKDIERIEAKQDAVVKMATDIEVIKVKLELIEQRLPRQAGNKGE